MEDRRIGVSPKPTFPSHYLNEQQLYGLEVLQDLGWKLVCVRRRSLPSAIVILMNSNERKIGVLGNDGMLRVGSKIKVRH